MTGMVLYFNWDGFDVSLCPGGDVTCFETLIL